MFAQNHHISHDTVPLRTVPTFVTAHTFCASRDTRVSFDVSLMEGYFCAVLNYAEKSELSKCSWHPLRKFGGNHVFFKDD